MHKTTVDKSITIMLIIYSMVFIIPLMINKNLWFSEIWMFLILSSCILIVMGLWKYEYYRYDTIQIKKYNFLGIFSRSYSLSEMTSYKNKFIYIGYAKNPMAILAFISKKSRKFIEYNSIEVSFLNEAKLKIDERVMSNQDFTELKKLIKHSKLHKKV